MIARSSKHENREDVIVFSPAFGEALYRMPASGGQPSRLTTLDAKTRESVHGWTRGDREIVYLDENEVLMSVDVTAVAGASLRVSPPRALFKLPPALGIDVTPDGERIIVATLMLDEPPPTIHVILGWSPEPKESEAK